MRKNLNDEQKQQLMKIGLRLSDLRNKKNITQELAAESLDVSRQTIHRQEYGLCIPDIIDLMNYCQIYDVSADEILFSQNISLPKDTSQLKEILHGFMKIYDKSAEQKQKDFPLTRIEHTFDALKPVSLEKVTILEVKSSALNPKDLDNLNYCIVTLCLVLQANGIDFEPYITKLNYRRRQRIMPYLYGNSQELEYDLEILNNLLNNIKKLFDADIEAPVTDGELIADKNGFIRISDDMEMPFD